MVASVAPMRIGPTPFPASTASTGPEGSGQSWRAGAASLAADALADGVADACVSLFDLQAHTPGASARAQIETSKTLARVFSGI
jgi:hypothetical protein